MLKKSRQLLNCCGLIKQNYQIDRAYYFLLEKLSFFVHPELGLPILFKRNVRKHICSEKQFLNLTSTCL